MKQYQKGIKMKDDYKLTQEEAAKYLGVETNTLANWRSKKTGPKYYKPTDKLVYYFKSDLDEWIKRKGK